MPSAAGDDRAVGATARQILELAEAARLLPIEDLAALRAQWTGSKLDADGGELARSLVRSGKLTKHQAAGLYQNQVKALSVGDYVLLDRIGAGGIGTVYKARKHDGRDLVAVKVLNSASSRSADAVKRFRREAEAAIRLNHPDIARAIEAGEAEGRLFLVMELLDGVDLSTYVKQNGPLPVEQAVECIVAASRGLAYAHAQGIVHRDIKPGNLFLTRGREVKLLDLGLARMSDAATGGEELTQVGQVMGTVDFMAPEQALNTRSADKRADIYSLGCTFYRLVTGANPYGGESLVEKILSHREHPIPSLRAKNPAVNPATDAVLRRMLAKNPDDRYQTMDELADELRRSLTDASTESAWPTESVGAVPPMPVILPSGVAPISQTSSPSLLAVPVEEEPKRHIPAVVYVAAVLVLLAVGSMALRLLVGEPPSEPDPRPGNSLAQATGGATPTGPASAPSPTSTGAAGETPSPAATAGNASRPTPTASPTPSPAAAPSATAAAPTPAVGSLMPANPAPTAATPTATTPPVPAPPPLAAVASSTVASSTGASSTVPPVAGNPPSGNPAGTAMASAAPVIEAPPAATKKHPVPDAAALADAVKLIRTELFKDEYSRLIGPPAYLQLADALLNRAQTLENDPVGRFALLSEARDAALQAVEMTKADEAARAATAEYEIDRYQWLADGIKPVADRLSGGPVIRQLAGEIYLIVDEAVAERKIEQAERLVKLAVPAARKSQDAALLRLVVEREKKIAKDRTAQAAAYRMRDQLAAKPDDPPANAGWGKYLCYVLGDWEQGLPHLAKGNDAILKELASKGLPPPTDTAGRVAVGDLWWSRAERVTNAALKNDLQLGAAYWYQQAVKESSGLTSTKLDKRIDETRAMAAVFAAIDPTKPMYLRLPVSQVSPMYLRLIEPGSFTMGSPPTETNHRIEETQHPVLLTKPFYLGVTEVTEEQWRVIGGRTPSNSTGDPQAPVGTVFRSSLDSFFQTLNRGPYGSFLRFRLPTEAEWEYAARAGTTTAYYWGDDFTPAAAYAASGNSGGAPKRVGGRRPNAWGLYDMLGNSSEHCFDIYDRDFYGTRLAIDPVGPQSGSGTSYVLRGGGYFSPPGYIRAAQRSQQSQSASSSGQGLRIACEAIGNIPPALVLRDPPPFALSPEAAAVPISAP